MNFMQTHPETRQWLTADHMELLATVDRWLDEAEPGASHPASSDPKETET